MNFLHRFGVAVTPRRGIILSVALFVFILVTLSAGSQPPRTQKRRGTLSSSSTPNPKQQQQKQNWWEQTKQQPSTTPSEAKNKSNGNEKKNGEEDLVSLLRDPNVQSVFREYLCRQNNEQGDAKATSGEEKQQFEHTQQVVCDWTLDGSKPTKKSLEKTKNELKRSDAILRLNGVVATELRQLRADAEEKRRQKEAADRANRVRNYMTGAAGSSSQSSAVKKQPEEAGWFDWLKEPPNEVLWRTAGNAVNYAIGTTVTGADGQQLSVNKEVLLVITCDVLDKLDLIEKQTKRECLLNHQLSGSGSKNGRAKRSSMASLVYGLTIVKVLLLLVSMLPIVSGGSMGEATVGGDYATIVQNLLTYCNYLLNSFGLYNIVVNIAGFIGAGTIVKLLLVALAGVFLVQKFLPNYWSMIGGSGKTKKLY